MQATVDELLPTNDIDGVPQLSVADINVGEGVGVVLHGSETGAPQFMLGGTRSKIEVSVWLHSTKLPQASVALQVKTEVVVHPVVDELVPTRVIAGVPQLSVALINEDEGVGVVLHGRLTGSGQTMTGGTRSKTEVMTWLHSAILPQASVALHVNT